MHFTGMFRLTPTMNSNFFHPVKVSPIGLSNGNILCSLWGANWIFIYSHLLLTTETRIQSQTGICEIYVHQSGTGASFSPSIYIGLPLSVSFHHLHPHVALTRRKNGRSLGTSQKRLSLSEVGEPLIERYFHIFFFRGETLFAGSQYASGRPCEQPNRPMYSVGFLGPRPHAGLINIIFIALRVSHAAPLKKKKKTKIFVKTQPPIDDQNFVIISSSKTQNSSQMFSFFAMLYNPAVHFPSSYLVFPTFFLATSPTLPQGRADIVWETSEK